MVGSTRATRYRLSGDHSTAQTNASTSSVPANTSLSVNTMVSTSATPANTVAASDNAHGADTPANPSNSSQAQAQPSAAGSIQVLAIGKQKNVVREQVANELRPVQNFHVAGGRDCIISGERLAVDAFQAFLLEGNSLVVPFNALTSDTSSGDPYAGVLEALSISLSTLHRHDEQQHDFLDLLKQSRGVNAHQLDSLEINMIDHASFLLATLEPLTQTTFQVGYMNFDVALQGYEITIAPPWIPGEVRRVVWIFTDQPNPSLSTRWSGFVPTLPDPATGEDPESELSDLDDDMVDALIQPEHPGHIERWKGFKKIPGHVVDSAPPESSDLPWAFMGSISSLELLSFFPNHALHWHAITPRLIEDGWQPKGITTFLNESRSLSGVDEVLGNTVVYCIKASCAKFYEQPDWSFREFSRKYVQRMTAEHWEPGKHAQRNAEISQKMENTEWKATRAPVLKQGWSLYEIGEFFWNKRRSFPCHGVFTDKVRLTMLNQYPLPGEARNPPLLHPSYVPGELPLPEYARRKIDVSNQNVLKESDDSLPKEFEKKMQITFKTQRNRDTVSEACKSDPNLFICEQPELVADETLLWLLSQDGGNMSVSNIEKVHAAYVEEQNESREPDTPKLISFVRTTISKRKQQALELRAKRNGSTYEVEHQLFKTVVKKSSSYPRRAARRTINPLPAQGSAVASSSGGAATMSNNLPAQALAPVSHSGGIADMNDANGSQVDQSYPGSYDPQPQQHNGGIYLQPAQQYAPPGYNPAPAHNLPSAETGQIDSQHTGGKYALNASQAGALAQLSQWNSQNLQAQSSVAAPMNDTSNWLDPALVAADTSRNPVHLDPQASDQTDPFEEDESIPMDIDSE